MSNMKGMFTKGMTYLGISIMFALIVVGGMMYISTPVSAGIGDNYIINGTAVYIDDANIYLSANPHTISNSQEVTFELISKNFEGSADIVFGFDTDKVQPKTALYYNPTTVVTEESYTCNSPYWFNYTTTPKMFYCWRSEGVNNTANATLVYSHAYDRASIPLKTAYWNVSTSTDWQDLSGSFTPIDYEYSGMDKWYYKQFNVVKDQKYILKSEIQVALGENSKYWVCVKPHAETISQAVTNGHLYCLDPWFASDNFLYRKKLTMNNALSNVTLTNIPVLVHLNSTNFVMANINDDCRDVVFTDDDETTQLYHEIDYTNSTDCWLWVKIPSVTKATATEYFYIYYGSSTATYDISRIDDVWDDYSLVVHMSDTRWYDSAGHNANGTTGGATTTSALNTKIGLSAIFDEAGGDDYITFVDDADLDGVMTMQEIIYRSTYEDASSWETTWFKRDGAITGGYNEMSDEPLRVGYIVSASALAGTPEYSLASNSKTWSLTSSWLHHFSTNGVYLNHSVNGEVDKYTADADTLRNNANDLILGVNSGGTNEFNGNMDEFRWSTVARSSSWVLMDKKIMDDAYLTYGVTEGFGYVDSSNFTSYNGIKSTTGYGTYSPKNKIGFQITSFGTVVHYVGFESNFTGTLLNYTADNTTTSLFYYNLTDYSVGNYSVKWYLNKTTGEMINTTTVFFSLIKNTTVYPQITNLTPSNTTYYSSSVWANTTTNLGSDTYLPSTSYCGAIMNGTTYTMTNSSGNWNKNIASLGDGVSGIAYTCNSTNRLNYTVNINTTLVAYNFTMFPRYLNITSYTSCDGQTFNKFNYYAVNTTGSQIVGTGTVGTPITNIPIGNTMFSFQNSSSTYLNVTENYTITTGTSDTLIANRYLIINVTAVYDELAPTTPVLFSLSITNATNSTTTVANVWNWTQYWNEGPVGSLTMTIDNTSLYIPRNYYNTTDSCSYWNPTLYLIQSADGHYVRWHIYNAGGAAISGAVVTIQKQIGGSYVTVQEALSDGTGTATTYLDAGTSYMLYVSASGYTTYSTGITPSYSDQNIILGASSGTVYPSWMFDNLQYGFQPMAMGIEPDNGCNTTNYTVKYMVLSGDSSLQSYGMYITYNDSVIWTGSGTLATGETLSATFNITNYTKDGLYTEGDLSTISKIYAYSNFSKVGFGNYTVTKGYMLTNYCPSNYTLTEIIGNISATTDINITSFIFLMIAIVVGILAALVTPNPFFSGFAILGTLVIGTFLGLVAVPLTISVAVLFVSLIVLKGGMF